MSSAPAAESFTPFASRADLARHPGSSSPRRPPADRQVPPLLGSVTMAAAARFSAVREPGHNGQMVRVHGGTPGSDSI